MSLRKDAPLLSFEEERRLFEAAERRPGFGERHLVVLQLALYLALPERTWRALRLSDVSADGENIKEVLAAGLGRAHALVIPEPLRRSLAKLVDFVTTHSPLDCDTRSILALTPLLSVRGRPLSVRRLREIVQLLRVEADLGPHVTLALLLKTARRRRRPKRAP